MEVASSRFSTNQQKIKTCVAIRRRFTANTFEPPSKWNCSQQLAGTGVGGEATPDSRSAHRSAAGRARVRFLGHAASIEHRRRLRRVKSDIQSSIPASTGGGTASALGGAVPASTVTPCTRRGSDDWSLTTVGEQALSETASARVQSCMGPIGRHQASWTFPPTASHRGSARGCVRFPGAGGRPRRYNPLSATPKSERLRDAYTV